MSTEVVTSTSPALEDLGLDDALEQLREVRTYIDRQVADIALARKAEADLLTIIQIHAETRGATKYVGSSMRFHYKTQKSGSASVHEPAALRTMLISEGSVPRAEIDAALAEQTIVSVKPDLRKLRKLQEYGNSVSALITPHIAEPISREILVVEPIEVNVTPIAPTPGLAVIDGGRA